MALPITKGRAEGEVLFNDGSKRHRASVLKVQFEGDERGIINLKLVKTGEVLNGIPHGPGSTQWGWPGEYPEPKKERKPKKKARPAAKPRAKAQGKPRKKANKRSK